MRNFLVTVTGLTPQVVTETLYYYTAVARPPVSFDEIRAITTLEGKRRIVESLLTPEMGYFHQFCRDYTVQGLHFDESCIDVIGGDVLLNDIRTIEDNGRMAAHIIKIIRDLTSRPDTALYCSIAGGRKTMGAYLALALQLFGRQQDHLSHVLISPEFESSPEFYYIPLTNKQIRARDVRGLEVFLETRNASIELADIPFVSVRRFLPKKMDFPVEEIVRRLQVSVEGPRDVPDISINIRQKKLRISGMLVGLQPRELTLYTLLADARQMCKKKDCRGCAVCTRSMNDLTTADTAKRLLDIYRIIVGPHSGNYERAVTLWGKRPPDAQYFMESFSKVNAKLRKTLVEYDYPFVEIAAMGNYDNKRYGIFIQRNRIKITGI